MDIYDFDGTLYCGDSTRDFLVWCARRYPRIVWTLPRTGAAAGACFGAHAISKTLFKAALYRFLPLVPDIEREVERFWNVHERRISGPCTPAPGDIVVSAGPEFLLRGVCDARDLELIGSQVDPFTGRVLGPNCSNEEKVKRLLAAHPELADPARAPERFYTDSLDDAPLAALARKAYLVRNGALQAL